MKTAKIRVRLDYEPKPLPLSFLPLPVAHVDQYPGDRLGPQPVSTS
jgi:hypothetical protein